MYWMTLPFRRYADLKGRSTRREYWMFVLLNVIALIVWASAVPLLESSDPDGPIAVAWLASLRIYLIAAFIPSLAVQVRRFHDLDHTGWAVLVNVIPYIGFIIVMVYMCLDGTKGPNKFGDDPKGRASTGHSSAKAAVAAPAPPCRECGMSLAPGVNYCDHCGTPAKPRPCQGCREELPSGARFCSACGSPA